MRIEKYLNTNKKEVDDRVHNIWIGISLGNKYFTHDRIQKYIEWAVAHTKERVLVVIGDIIHAANIEIFSDRTPQAALRKALKLGDERYTEIQAIVDRLPKELQEKVRIVRWREVIDASHYQHNLRIIKGAYATNSAFTATIRSIVKAGRPDRSKEIETLPDVAFDKLAEYVLNEIPHFINGVQGYGEEVVYTLIPYPGLSLLDQFLIDLQTGIIFPEIKSQLQLENKIAILEAYTD